MSNLVMDRRRFLGASAGLISMPFWAPGLGLAADSANIRMVWQDAGVELPTYGTSCDEVTEKCKAYSAGEALGEARVELVEHLGGTTALYATTSTGESLIVVAPGQSRIAHGDLVPIGFDAENGHVFSKDGAALRH